MPRQILRVPVSPEQNDYLKKLEQDSLASYIRKLIRDAHPNFPPDKAVGVRDDYFHNWKQTLTWDMHSLSIAKFPLPIEKGQKMIIDYLLDLRDGIADRDPNHPYLSIVNEGLDIVKNQGYPQFMRWFGFVPIFTDETRTTVMGLGIKSIDDD